MMSDSTDVATTSIDYGDLDGAGFDATDSTDYARCLVYVMQALSPDVTDGKARPGDIKITGLEIYKTGSEGLLFVPIHRVRQYVRWQPRDAGGGLAGVYMPDDPVVIDALKRSGGSHIGLKVDGDDLTLTILWGVLALPDGPTGPAFPVVMPLSRTKIKPYTMAMVKLRSQVNPRTQKPFPIFAHLMIMRTAQVKNKNNQPYFVPVFDFAPNGIIGNKPGSMLLLTAADCYRSFSTDGINVDHSQVASEDVTAAPVGAPDDDIPF